MALIKGINSSGVPVGTFIDAHRTHTTPPVGFLYCDGSSLSTTTYAALFAVIGYTYGGSGISFNLPDRRGYFPRGLDTTSSTRDPDKTGRTGGDANKLGSTQVQATRKNGLGITDPGHTHYFSNTNGKYDNYPNAGDPLSYNGTQAFTTSSSVTGVSITTGDNETRPINIATNYFIAYI